MLLLMAMFGVALLALVPELGTGARAAPTQGLNIGTIAWEGVGRPSEPEPERHQIGP